MSKETRSARVEVFKETRDMVDKTVEMALKQFIDQGFSGNDEENLLMIKLLRSCYGLMDYAEFQARQLDTIEDRLDEIVGLLEKKE